MRQGENEGTCYLIAPLVTLVRLDPQALYNGLIKLLEQGGDFANLLKADLAIYPYQDLPIEGYRLGQALLVKKIAKIMKLALPLFEGIKPISEHFKELPQEFTYYYCGYTSNVLMRLLLLKTRFEHINSERKTLIQGLFSEIGIALDVPKQIWVGEKLSHRYFVCKNSDGYSFIPSIQKLQELLYQLTGETKFLTSTTKTKLSRYASKSSKVSAETLKRSDSMLMSQEGGYIEKVMALSFSIPVRTASFTCNTPCELLKSIAYLRSIDPQPFYLINLDHIDGSAHAFTFNPAKCIFWQQTEDAEEFIKHHIIEPAERILDKKSYYHNLTNRERIKWAQKYSNEEHLEKIRHVLMEVHPNQLEPEKIISELHPTISQNKIDQVRNAWPKQPMHLVEAVERMRALMLHLNIGSHTSHDLEMIICKKLDLPITINIGDLNYSDFASNCEKPFHQCAVITYDFVTLNPGVLMKTKKQLYHPLKFDTVRFSTISGHLASSSKEENTHKYKLSFNI